DAPDILPYHSGPGIEVDTQFVRMIEVAAADRMRMQLNASKVDDPCQPSVIIDDHFFGRSSRRKRQRDGSQPLRAFARRPLLVKSVAFGAIDETFENDRTIADPFEGSRCNRQVIAYEVEFCKLYLLREIWLGWMRYPHLASIDVQYLNLFALGHQHRLPSHG